MYITPKQVFEKVDFSLSETPEKPFPGQILTSLYFYFGVCWHCTHLLILLLYLAGGGRGTSQDERSRGAWWTDDTPPAGERGGKR